MPNNLQPNYVERQSEAVAGMPATMGQWDAITRTNESSTAIGFGLAVKRGDDPEKCALAGALVDFLGVSLRDQTQDIANDDTYAQYNNVAILTRGYVWVQVSGTPTQDDPVHYNATTGVFAISGGTGPIVGARWVKSPARASGIALLHLGGSPQAAA